MNNKADYVLFFDQNTLCEFLSELVSDFWIDQVQRLTIRNWTYQTAKSQPFVAFLDPQIYQRIHHLRCGIASIHPSRVGKRGCYQIVFIQQETIVKQRFSLRGSHQVVSELRLFLFGFLYLQLVSLFRDLVLVLEIVFLNSWIFVSFLSFR